jgi:queuine tRNA-ribosyltransferase
MHFRFDIEKKLEDNTGAPMLGRAGIFRTPHGDIPTPAFVPVGTKATVKAITPEMLESLGADVMLANTYHLLLQPGDEVVQKAGGLHSFMNWKGPMMTDSGGFQVFSLGAAYGKDISKITKAIDPSLQITERSSADEGVPKLATIGADGVSFRSHIDGTLYYITPEKSIEIQQNLGADIIFAFDECTSPAEPFRYQEEALHRTHAWAKRSLVQHEKMEQEKASEEKPRSKVLGSPLGEYAVSARPSPELFPRSPQALFGIVQGGREEELRKKSAQVISEMKTESGREFDGFGIGGSFAKEDMSTAVKWVNEILPENKPRHLLGIGEPEDLFMGVENGVDFFDCVAPTRMARNGTLYTHAGKINMFNAEHKEAFVPIEENCGCYTCKNYTRAYVAHLFRAKEMLGGTLATIHNLYFIVSLVKGMRNAIVEGNFEEYKASFFNTYKA